MTTVAVEATEQAQQSADDGPLSARDRRILAFERQWFCNAGSKESAIIDTFGVSPTRYFQILNALLDDPRAMRQQPQVVARLRRLRAARNRARRGNNRILRHRR